MNTLVVYDSVHGNTERVAQVVAEALGGKAQRVGDVSPESLGGLDLLIVGSPTHGGFPTEQIHTLVKAALALEGVQVAAFDTRTKRSIFGYAAPKIALNLEQSGGTLLAPPEGFVVRGIKGPLAEGELERAAGWAQALGS
jgi:flavodoxin